MEDEREASDITQGLVVADSLTLIIVENSALPALFDSSAPSLLTFPPVTFPNNLCKTSLT